jgi:acyl-CoA synthetase (AMP-forming)/AMP-acid ligase II
VNIATLLELPATIAPDQEIVRDAHRTASYAQLINGAGRTGSLLKTLGVGAGSRVGIFAVNSLEVVELIFAAAACGAVAVPMNFRARHEETAHLVRDSGVAVLFCDPRYAGLIDEAAPDSQSRRVVLDDDYKAARDACEPVFEVSYAVEDSDPAILIYTSGTTSLPKGVPLTHGALSNFALSRTDVTDGTLHGRTLLSVPLYHVAGLSTLLVAVFGGRTVVLMPQFDADQWLVTVAAARVSHAFLVPTTLARVVGHDRFEDHDLSSLESVSYGAAPMPEAVIRRAIERLPAVGFSGAYGMSETTSTVTVLDEDDHRAAMSAPLGSPASRRLGSVGRAVEGVELRVRTGEGDVAAPGVVGEVLVRTERSMRAYWRAGSEGGRGSTDAEGWLSTGDLGYLDHDGYLFLVGRNTDMIIRGGENVAPREIEELLHRHDQVRDVGVVGVPDELWGEEVVAAVVLGEDPEATVQELRAMCDALAAFKRPARFVIVPRLPRTSTGKLVRRELVDVCRLEPAPEAR